MDARNEGLVLWPGLSFPKERRAKAQRPQSSDGGYGTVAGMFLPLPDRPFPAYSYVPGKFPHPLRDPAGHSFGQAPESCQPLTPENANGHETYLWGIQLFNHGYYWEAHEVWEQVW